ncbi:MAG: NADH-quinone oxidoreductase subunit NuoK [Frankiaceae bacterium]|jgi:NADH-quinone oxidoreductase subunit K
MHLIVPLLLAALLFAVGVYGLLARRNAVAVLMAVELMLNAANLNFVAFSAYLRDSAGQVFALFVIVLAAAEVGIGLAIVLLLFRNRGTVAIDEVRSLADADPPEPAPAGAR